ncbi:MAG TPA: class I SAM-dependent methyltransferase [Gaiellaceae bacterium]|nr:class I SAM-dependent methyltransferase [Gaiellaceae bacterium]
MAFAGRGNDDAVRLRLPFLEPDNARYYLSERGVAEYASYGHLMESEGAVLELLRAEGLGRMRMLDLGVGGGRTTVHYAPHAGEYIGADFSEPLVQACRERFRDEQWPHARFEVADARHLPYPDDHFDFVLFSWNGIDAVGGLEDRLRAFREIRRVLKPGHRFVFSAHNLEYVFGPASLPRRLLRRTLNPRLASLRDADWGVVVDERVGLKYESHPYIRPAAQLEQLRGVGFTECVALRPDGTEVPDPRPGDFATRHWLYYRCRA